MESEHKPRHCTRCNQMSLGHWRADGGRDDVRRCPICRAPYLPPAYQETATRARVLLEESRASRKPSSPTEPVTTLNCFAVASSGDGTVIVLPPVGRRLTQAECLNLAAYLVAVSGARLQDFRAHFEAISSV